MKHIEQEKENHQLKDSTLNSKDEYTATFIKGDVDMKMLFIKLLALRAGDNYKIE